MLMTKYFRIVTLTGMLVSAIAFAQTPYDEGQKALREQNWTQAAEYFKEAIDSDKKSADAAMYWRAHALYKAGRDKEAERQVKSLARKYPDSRWVKESQVLAIEHDGQNVILNDQAVLDDELRMFALSRLMERDPERALPLVLEMIKESGSGNRKRDLMFMLGMSDDPRAQEQIAIFARDKDNPSLQADAIRMLGMASDHPSTELLAKLYAESDSEQVKKAVIEAHIISDASGSLVDLLESEQDPDLQAEIIHALGVTDATVELAELYPKLKGNRAKIAALEAFGIAGDTATLKKILESESDPALRKSTIHGIAMEGDEDAAEVLQTIYQNSSNTAEKHMVLESLVMLDNAEDFALSVVRTETDSKLRRQAILMLGVMESTDELATLYETLDSIEMRKAALEAMMVADDMNGLMKIIESESDPDLRAAAIHALAVNGGNDTAEYLLSLYPKGTSDEKQAVIQSMMIMDHTKGLVALLDVEKDPNRKREILQMLTVMDSEEADEILFKALEEKQ